MKYLGQFIAYAAFAVVVGLFSVWPTYRMLLEQEAIVSLSYSHAAQRVGECRTLTQEELNELPPNMRKPSECPRQRHPIYVELRADDQLLYSDTLPPSGIWDDGKANVYKRIKLDAGTHRIFVGMNDSGTNDSFDYQRQENLTLAPGQNLVINFDDLTSAFTIQ